MTRLPRHLNPLHRSLVAAAIAIGCLLMLVAPSLSGGAPASSDDLKAYFDGEDAQTPLDLYGVRFGQTASTDLTLIIRTHKEWESSIVNPRFGRTLCVTLRGDGQEHPSGRLCAYPSTTSKT